MIEIQGLRKEFGDLVAVDDGRSPRNRARYSAYSAQTARENRRPSVASPV